LTSRPEDLPDFESPPVTEVALGVQFVPLIATRTFQFVELARTFHDTGFTLTDEQPLLEPMTQEVEESTVATQGLVMDLTGLPPPPRYWLTNSAKTVLLQLQRDRFVLNWRQIEPGNTYPRYEPLRDSFEENFHRLEQAINHLGLGALVPTQCQIDYINAIAAPRGLGRLDEVLTVWNPKYSDGFLSDPDIVRLAQGHRIEVDGQFRGRLYISAEPAEATGHKAAIVLVLTARGNPISDGLSGVLGFFDLGREWIVRAFASITTPSMHRVWKRMRPE